LGEGRTTGDVRGPHPRGARNLKVSILGVLVPEMKNRGGEVEGVTRIVGGEKHGRKNF